MGESNKKQIAFNCEYCNKKTTQAKCYYEKAKHHYCSDKCRKSSNKHLKKGAESPRWNRKSYFCDYCGKKFERADSYYNKSNNHFCSTECMGKYKSIQDRGENNPNWKGHTITFECDMCKKKSTQPYCQFIVSNNHFCSTECMGKYKSIHGRGENSPRWNKKLTNEERIINRDYSEYVTWRISVYERDKYICQYCGERGGDKVAHHLDGYDNFPDKRLDIDNGVTLCVHCHRMFHKIYGYGKNTKKQYLEWIDKK